MKKLACLLFIFSLCKMSNAQNVGIGNPSPAEKLDVTGNINVTGTIKANGVDGTAGQVLMKNNTGVFSWGDVAQYKNVVGFSSGASTISNTNYTWTVPAGITKIFVECWGAGGGGAAGGGGGGGGYAAAQWTVSPGTTVNIVIGGGGEGAASAAADGENGNNTTVTINLLQLIAVGGDGGHTATGGFPGRFGSNSASFLIYGQSGTAGESSSETYGQYSPTTFYTAINYGAGGAGGNTAYTQKNGAFYAFNTSTAATVKNYLGQVGAEPGGGGGGSNYSPYYGGLGLAIIHY